MDLETLEEARAALALYDEDGFLDNNDLQRVMPVVRWTLKALANGERVEWCEVHHQAARPKAPTCIMVAYLEAVRATVADPCRIVSKLLIPPTEEE